MRRGTNGYIGVGAIRRIPMPPQTVNVAVVGLGYWGPNLLRAAGELNNLEVTTLCDLDAERLAQYGRLQPQARLTQRFDEVLADDSVDAVVIATPIATHHRLTKAALEAGK